MFGWKEYSAAAYVKRTMETVLIVGGLRSVEEDTRTGAAKKIGIEKHRKDK